MSSAIHAEDDGEDESSHRQLMNCDLRIFKVNNDKMNLTNSYHNENYNSII